MKTVLLNQVSGPMFTEFAEMLAEEYETVLITGSKIVNKKEKLTSITAPAYNKKNKFTRFISWLSYFLFVMKKITGYHRDGILVIVSNPPFLAVTGFLMHIVRRQKYIVLVYDLYPDILVQMNMLKSRFLTKNWIIFNKLVYKKAAAVITIGDDIAKNLEKVVQKNKIKIVKCWVDTDLIKPTRKSENRFAKGHNIVEKKTVLYSGNMGFSHNIKDLIDAAKLNQEKSIHFMFIGDGALKGLVVDAQKDRSEFISLLPFQPEENLKFSMSAADIGVASYQAGTEGCMVPSKAYYYMAAGLCLVVISNYENELTNLVQQQECGIWVKAGDPVKLLDNLTSVLKDEDLLMKYKDNSRLAAEKLHSKKNAGKMVRLVQSVYEM